MAEKEGFEPSIPFWGIHDFQSCALGQLRDFSILLTCFSVSFDILLYLSEFVNPLFYEKRRYAQKNQLTTFPFADIILKLASVAQSVVHLTRNEKVACSSQVTSSNKCSTSMQVEYLL